VLLTLKKKRKTGIAHYLKDKKWLGWRAGVGGMSVAMGGYLKTDGSGRTMGGKKVTV